MSAPLRPCHWPLLFFLFFFESPVGHATNQLVALRALYLATDGASWTANTGWMDGTLEHHVCLWTGVTCESDLVKNFDMLSNNLVGSLPTQFVSAFS